MNQMQVFQGVPFEIVAHVARVFDLDLAKALGYARLRDIRKLIFRLLPFLPGIQQRATVARYESRPGVWQNRTVIEYYLTEAEALFIAAKSNTLRANELTKDIIAAFLEARDFIHRMLTAPMDQVMRELTESRAIFAEEQNRLIDEVERVKGLLAVKEPFADPGEDLTEYASTAGVNRHYNLPPRSVLFKTCGIAMGMIGDLKFGKWDNHGSRLQGQYGTDNWKWSTAVYPHFDALVASYHATVQNLHAQGVTQAVDAKAAKVVAYSQRRIGVGTAEELVRRRAPGSKHWRAVGGSNVVTLHPPKK